MAGTGTAHLRDDALLSVRDLVVEYRPSRRETVHAVSSVSLDVRAGETLGLVGESGCGKSTAGRAMLMLDRPTAGEVVFGGRDLTGLGARELRRARRHLQMIFQDPTSSLNPRRRVRDLVSEGLSIARIPKPWGEIVDGALAAVGLDPAAVADRRPHELSGGQCQRVAIARALTLEPSLIVCDEVVSALDVSVQAQILNLLEDMKQRYALTLVFIAHDLAVVANISDRVAVMYLGKLCEVAGPETLFRRAAHPYSRALIDSVPDPEVEVETKAVLVAGELPSPLDPPSGCRFRTRCPRADDVCRDQQPMMREVGPDHFVACHHPGDVAR